jgi:peptidoglycan/xylan/chitin deacetylase (PgdA/CDA1 family)
MGFSPRRRLLARVADGLGFARLAGAAYGWHGLMVLNYHRIGNPAGTPFDRDLYSATTADFEEQVRFLRKNFDIVGLGDLDDVLLRKSRTRGVMITFDDGYRDNFEQAFPILKQQGAPAVFFLTTGFLDQRNVAWWDEIAWMINRSSKSVFHPGPWFSGPPLVWSGANRDHVIARLLKVYKQLPANQTASYLEYISEETGSGRCPKSEASDAWMTWDMVREMSAAGMGIGSHTVSHPILSRLNEDQVQFELVESKRRLEQQFNISVDAISYPVGQTDSFNERSCEIVKSAGYRWAFSFYGGYTEDLVNPYDIPRTAVELDCCLPTFRSLTRVPSVFHP